MEEPFVSEVTQILQAIEDGDAHASEDLLPLVYGELRKLAAHRMSSESPGHTMQATALVHEAYLRLVGNDGEAPSWASRAVFFAAAHIPGSLEEGRSFAYIAAFFVFNGTLTTAILYTVQRSRDVIWIGVVHYLMDIAIEAF